MNTKSYRKSYIGILLECSVIWHPTVNNGFGHCRIMAVSKFGSATSQTEQGWPEWAERNLTSQPSHDAAVGLISLLSYYFYLTTHDGNAFGLNTIQEDLNISKQQPLIKEFVDKTVRNFIKEALCASQFCRWWQRCSAWSRASPTQTHHCRSEQCKSNPASQPGHGDTVFLVPFFRQHCGQPLH